MGIFGGKNKGPKFPSAPRYRRIPTLNPEFFEAMQARIRGWGGDDDFTGVYLGVANAIYNVSAEFFNGFNPYMLKTFLETFDDIPSIGPDAADHMINFVIIRDKEFQATLEALLSRLLDVYSRPPN